MFCHLRALAFGLVSVVVSLPSAAMGADMFMPPFNHANLAPLGIDLSGTAKMTDPSSR